MNLSLKATRLLLEALAHYWRCLDQQLQMQGISEDEISDLVNDRLYLDAIKQDLNEYQDALQQQRAGIGAC